METKDLDTPVKDLPHPAWVFDKGLSSSQHWDPRDAESAFWINIRAS